MTSAKRPDGIPAYELWPREAAKARGRLYPATVLYTAYTLALLGVGRPPARTSWPRLAFFAGGIAAWTLIEYFVHRYILHGRFPDGPGVVQHFLHKRFDHLHWEHHARPWDGNHINGRSWTRCRSRSSSWPSPPSSPSGRRRCWWRASCRATSWRSGSTTRCTSTTSTTRTSATSSGTTSTITARRAARWATASPTGSGTSSSARASPPSSGGCSTRRGERGRGQTTPS